MADDLAAIANSTFPSGSAEHSPGAGEPPAAEESLWSAAGMLCGGTHGDASERTVQLARQQAALATAAEHEAVAAIAAHVQSVREYQLQLEAIGGVLVELVGECMLTQQSKLNEVCFGIL